MNFQLMKGLEKVDYIKATVDSLYQSYTIVDAETRQVQSIIDLLTSRDQNA